MVGRRLLLPLLLWSLLLLPGPVAGFDSDDFNAANLAVGRWTFVNPRGDASVVTEGAGTGDARLRIEVPAGVEHDNWINGAFAPRLVQPCPAGDFTLEVRFDSPVAAKYQTQGLLAEEAGGGFLRFEVLGDGRRTRLFVAEIRDGAATVRADRRVFTSPPFFLRLERAGGFWRLLYSPDGANWSEGAYFSTQEPAATVGVYAGNAGSPAPAHTGIVDYVFDLAAPIVPEDGLSQVDLLPPNLLGISVSPRSTALNVGWQSDEPSTGSVSYGRTAECELGTVAAEGPAALEHTVTVDNLQPDTAYFLRIDAWDAAGNHRRSDLFGARTAAAAAACELDLWYGPVQTFGAPGKAQRWVNLLGDAAGCSDLAALSFRLNGGPERPLAVGPDGRRLAFAGDFNVEIPFSDLLPGSNRVEVIARDAWGGETVAETLVNYPALVWPLPWRIDWSAVTDLQSAVQVVDGTWKIEAGGVRPAAMAYDRVLAIGDLAWTDYEILVPFTVLAVDPAGYNPISTAPGFGFQMRWQGHTPLGDLQPNSYWLPVGASAWYKWEDRFRLFLNGRSGPSDPTGRKVQLGIPYLARMRVETGAAGEPLYRYRFWPAGETEPGTWDLAAAGLATDPRAGSLLLVAHHLDVRFGNLIVSPLAAADSTPPVISGIAVTPGVDRAVVAWATDEPSRGALVWGSSPLCDAGRLEESSWSTAHSLALEGLQPDTSYCYRVEAADAAGNRAVSELGNFRTLAQTYTLALATTGQGAITATPAKALYAAGEQVSLAAVPAAGWRFAEWSGDLSGTANPAPLVMDRNRSVGAAFVQETVSLPPFSDEFAGAAIDPGIWTFVNPLGDAAVAVSDGRAALQIPTGREHDLWTYGNYAPRLLQPAPAGDFEIEAKFDSPQTLRYQMQGIIVEGTDSRFLRCELLGDGSRTRLFVASVQPGAAVVRADRSIPTGAPKYLRVGRSGSRWSVLWSADGTTWTSGASFNEELAAERVGFYGGNAGSNPAFTALVDWFRVVR